MSLNKARKRLIRKYRGMGNIIEECIPDVRNINSGSINASKLSTSEISFRNFEITLKQVIPKEEFNKLKGVLW